MSKVLVDRELLDSAATWLEVHAPGGGCVEGSVAEDLRAILDQPAEAEGPVEMGSDAWMALHLLDRLDVSADEEPRVQQVEEIVRRMGAALSAVTAERDRLESMLIRTATRHFALQIKDRADDKKLDECLSEGIAMLEAERDQLRAEVEALRKDAERFRHIERDCDSGMRGIYGDDWVEVIDGYIAEYAAMAAKEA